MSKAINECRTLDDFKEIGVTGNFKEMPDEQIMLGLKLWETERPSFSIYKQYGIVNEAITRGLDVPSYMVCAVSSIKRILEKTFNDLEGK